MTKTSGCPNCGSTDGYTVADRANGWVTYLGDWTGNEERCNGEDGLSYSRSKTVICESCKKRVPRPENHIPGLVGR